MNTPLISIIIPVYNCAPWLGEAIESCLNQTYENFEVIVVDDGSTDDSLNVASRYAPNVKIYTQLRKGAAAARNFGFSMSKGEYITYLDADDVFLPSKLSRQMQCLLDTQADFVFSDWRIMRPDQNNLEEPINLRQFDDLVLTLIHDKYPDECIIVGASLFKRSLIEKSKGWDEKVTVQDDHLFKFQIALLNPRFTHLPGVCVHYRKKHKPNTLGTKFLIDERHFVESYESITSVYEKFYELLENHQILTPQYIYPLLEKFEKLGKVWEHRSQLLFTKMLNIQDELKQRLLNERVA